MEGINLINLVWHYDVFYYDFFEKLINPFMDHKRGFEMLFLIHLKFLCRCGSVFGGYEL